jgi:hypothetical protein
MRLFLILFALIAAVLAVKPAQKPVVVTFADNTPSSIIDKAMAEIEAAGGKITHEYCKTGNQALSQGSWADMITALIKGFAAKVSEVTLNKISEMAAEYSPFIEDDYVVKIDGSTDAAR